jgi:type I restriction enzyme S subunit
LPPLDALKPKYIGSIPDLKVFSLKVSNWKKRLDASFHLPIIESAIGKLKGSSAEMTIVNDQKVSERIILPGRFKRTYVTKDYGVPFLSGGEILQYDPLLVKFLSVTHHGKRISEELTIHENMILVTCSGTIGNVVLVPKHLDGWTASQHILRIIPAKDMNPGYIYTFLASSYGRELIRRFTYGSVVDEIDDINLGLVEFPLLSGSIQDKIGNPVLEASRKWTKAYELEKHAIATVEELIVSNPAVEVRSKLMKQTDE